MPSQQVDVVAVEALRERFRGELIGPGDPGYDEGRSVFNAMIDRRPALIAQCTGVADVRAALAWGREQGLPVAVRGGGHSVPGYAVCDGGLVIDLAPMKGVRVDPVAQTIRAQAGVTWGELDREAQEFGLAVTGGRVSSTGVSGLTLGSGSGWLERAFGLTSDSLLSADLVTADGRTVTASATTEPDLFWGLRGGGGNFGIVTEFEFRAHPVGPIVLGGMLVHPAERAGEVLRFYRDYMETAPDALGSGAAFITAPPAPFVPPEMQGTKVLAIVVCYAGPIDEGEAVVQPLREAIPPALDLIEPMPYTVVQQLVDGGNQPGFLNYWKAEFLPALPDAAIDTLTTFAGLVASPLTSVLVLPMGGAMARVPDGETALGNRDAMWNFHAIGMWADPTESDEHIDWARKFSEAMQPYCTDGVFLNFVGDEGEERVRSSYGEARYRRLAQLKATWDPDNVFRMNQNVSPAAVKV